MKEITQCVTTGAAATGANAASHQALALDPLGASLLAGTPLDASPMVVANQGDHGYGGDFGVGSSTSPSANGSPVRGSGNDNASVNTAASVSVNGGVSVDALLGHQMQSLQAESRARFAPLLVELETATAQAADLHARKQSLLLELRGVETDLTAALARSHALQVMAGHRPYSCIPCC